VHQDQHHLPALRYQNYSSGQTKLCFYAYGISHPSHITFKLAGIVVSISWAIYCYTDAKSICFAGTASAFATVIL
jgi:hypothetical protein